MEWSKIKNIILLILLGLNLFLLIMVASQELQARQFRQEAREEAVALLERNGIAVDASVLPEDTSLPTQVLEEDLSVAETLAHALLGEDAVQQSTGVRAVYSSSLGEMETFSTGRFAVDFTAQALPLHDRTAEEHAADLLQRAGIQAEYLDSSHAEGATRITYRQRWTDTPVFNAQITLAYQDGALRHMEGVLLPANGGVSQQEETITVATLLVRFLSQRNESGRMFSQIQALVPGYHLSGTRPFTLTPAWYVVTDTGTYVLSALDGSLF